MGAGKTTAIAAVSEIGPLGIDVRNTDASVTKPSTTVGLDYGELTLDNGERLRLYGTPGQQRFAFMWDILARGALGLVILIDNSRLDPLADLDRYLYGVTELIGRSACVVCPMLPVDVRERAEVLQLLDLLLLQFESRSPSELRA